MTLKDEIRNMLFTKDESIHNIEKYNVNYPTMSKALMEVIEEFPLVNMCLGAVLPKTEMNSKNRIKTLGFRYWAGDNFFERLQKIQKAIYKILINIDPQMNDVDKVLYVHDYIVRTTVFNSSKTQYFYPASVLIEGIGVCDSYTHAFLYIMELLGIECSYVCSDAQNHKWIYVKLDGEWYHIDACWDDSQSSNQKEVSHHYLLRNDSEFSNGLKKNHITTFKPIDVPSTSDRFKDWFVHDVNGDLFYFGGYWYYLNTEKNAIIKRRIEGKDYVVLFHGGTDSIDNLTISNGVVSFEIGGQKHSITL